jgi:hypothetical protein
LQNGCAFFRRLILSKTALIKVALIIGSGVDALRARLWTRTAFQDIVAINNAWQIRPDWNYLIHPDDFPVEKMPSEIDASLQHVITATQYIPIQNKYGGVIYAGATMAFTAGYWALGALKPDIMAFVGCDMVYPQSGRTHFYGNGAPDPLRADITLQSLEAKSARLMHKAAAQGCVCLNLSTASKSRLLFPRMSCSEIGNLKQKEHYSLLTTVSAGFNPKKVFGAIQREEDLRYMVASGKYWENSQNFDATALCEVDRLWLASLSSEQVRLVA